MSEMHAPSFWRTRWSWLLVGFLLIAGYFLLTEHAAHVVGVLPWLLLAACPLMHFFGHHHHHHGGSSGHDSVKDASRGSGEGEGQ